MDQATSGLATGEIAPVGTREIQSSAIDNGFAAVFGSMFNNGSDETELQGLCFDLISLCQPINGRPRKSMPVFSQILNAIPQVVNLNERQNTATMSDISTTASEVDSWISGSTKDPSRTSTWSCPFTEVTSDFSQGENSEAESDSTQSIFSNYLPITTRYLDERDRNEAKTPGSSQFDTKNLTNVDYRLAGVTSPVQGQGQEGTNLPVSMSNDVLKALRQFGLEGCLMPVSLPPNKTPHESNSFPKFGSPIGGMKEKQKNVSGDNNGNQEEWMSPLNISGTMLTNLLNRFTTGKEKGVNHAGTGNLPAGTSDAESTYTD